MEGKIRKYLEILKIELEDLVEDIEFNKDILTKRHEGREITEYVFMENIGLLKKEILGIEKVQKMLVESSKEINCVEDIRNNVENYFKDRIRSAGLPEVVFLLVNRKLEKVGRYMAIDDCD